MENCNCDFGCACNFSGFPNYGRCEALVGYHIRSGNYGNVSLDGLDFIYAASWPRAIRGVYRYDSFRLAIESA